MDLEAELRRRVPCIRAPPAFLRGRLRQLYHTVLEEVLRADALPGDADGLQKVRAWKLLVLIWRMLMRRTASTGAPGRRELEARLEQFEDGSWEALLAPSLQGQRPPGGARGAGDAEARRQRLLEDAVALVRAGGLSKARQLLASRGLAPGTAETLAELRDPARRPPRPAADLPPAARAFQPARPVELDRRIWTDCVRSAPKGSSSSLSGASFELLKLALDEDETLELQAAVAERYARAEIPASVARALGTGRMTALLKDNGRARGIVAGDAFRRLVGKALCRQYGSEMDDACAPFHYALSTRAGTDSAAHFLRAATDSDPAATIVSIDGIGAFDHVRRDRMIEKLLSLPEASAMVPFVLLSYGQPSTYLWTDDAGVAHEVRQGEGGEQGDPLMPALHSLAQHGARERARAQLQLGETLIFT